MKALLAVCVRKLASFVFVGFVWWGRRRVKRNEKRKAAELTPDQAKAVDAGLEEYYRASDHPSLADNIRRAGKTFIVLLCLTVAGCASILDRIAEGAVVAGEVTNVPPEPGTEPIIVEPVPVPLDLLQHSEEGSQRLLVKPEADTTHNLVILLPAKWNNSLRDIWLLDKDGWRHSDTGRRNINPPPNSNGNRRHIWFREPGTVYGAGSLVIELEEETKAIGVDFSVRSEQAP